MMTAAEVEAIGWRPLDYKDKAEEASRYALMTVVVHDVATGRAPASLAWGR
jgi:hypothetical protein